MSDPETWPAAPDAGAAVRALRDITDAVAAVTGRMLGLPDEEDDAR
jgi:hypothetical protein